MYSLREDSQINFAMGNVSACFCGGGGGGGLHKNVSQILAIIDCSSGKIGWKDLVSKI